MNYVIPILGKGERFVSYKEDKPFININGKAMIETIVEPILNNKENSIWIFCRYEFLDKLNKIFNDKRIKIIPLQETIGAAETIFLSCNYLPQDEAFTSIDCDTIINKEAEKIISENKSNCIYTFIDDKKQGIFSYIIPQGNRIKEIHEKKPLSIIASSGVYQFESAKQYIKIYKDNFNNKESGKELYISNIINAAISKGEIFTYKNIDNQFTCVGTPMQLEIYLKQNINPKIFVFDLDRTLVYDINENTYGIEKNIIFCNGLYELGHKIIIHTARGMLTNGNDIKEIEKKYSDKIKKILKEKGIKYHELIFGKPYADIYIDDKAINAFDDLNKKAGFYSGSKLESRFMNNVIDLNDKIIKKGAAVQNEIFYYENIPNELSKFYPVIYNSKENELVMEKIKGNTASELLLNLKLSKENILQIVNSLNEIHSHTIIESDCDWLYAGKLLERYYENTSFYEKLGIKENEVLELSKLSKVSNHCIMHGDSVFTNIFLTENNEVKLIDPRGKIKNDKSIYGAACYDYAKMLQSLYGYDFILSDGTIPTNYLSFVREYFFNIIKEDKTMLKIKTKILILSMLPLHIDRPDRITKFIELFKTIV